MATAAGIPESIPEEKVQEELVDTRNGRGSGGIEHMDINSAENRRNGTETLQNPQVLEHKISNGATTATANLTISYEPTEGGVLHSDKSEIMDTHESEVFAEVASRVQVLSKDKYKDYDTNFHGENSSKEGYESSDINLPLQFPSFSPSLQEEDTQSTGEECNAKECNKLQNENLLDKEMTADNVNSLHDKLRGTKEQNIPEYLSNSKKMDHNESSEKNVVEEKIDEIPETEPAVQQISEIRENKMLLKSFPEHLEVQNLELTHAREDAEQEAVITNYEIAGTQPCKEPAPVYQQIVKEKPEDGKLEHHQQKIEMTGYANHVEEKMERETSEVNVKGVEEEIPIGEVESQFDEPSDENQIPYQSLFSASVTDAPADERLRTDGLENDRSADNPVLISDNHISETLVANQIDEGDFMLTKKKHVAESVDVNPDAKPTIAGDESDDKNLVDNIELTQDRNLQAIDRSDSVESKSTENQNYSVNKLPITDVETILEKKNNLKNPSELAFKDQDDGREGNNEIGQENTNGTIEEQKDQEGNLEESLIREEMITEMLHSNIGQGKAKLEEKSSYTSVTELTVLRLPIEKMVQKDEESLHNVEKTLRTIPEQTQATRTTELETQEETSISGSDAHWRKPHDMSEKMDVEKVTEEIDVGENQHMEIYEGQHEMVPTKEISAGKAIEEHKVTHSRNEIVDYVPRNKETGFTNDNSPPSVGVHEQNDVKRDKLSVSLHKEDECCEKEAYQVEVEKQIASGGMQDIPDSEAQEEINKSKAQNEMSSDKIESDFKDMQVEAIDDMQPFFDENAKNDDGNLSFLQYRKQEKSTETSEVKTQEHANGTRQEMEPIQSIDKVEKDEPLILTAAETGGNTSPEKDKTAEKVLVMDTEENSLAYKKKPEIEKFAAHVVHEYQNTTGEEINDLNITGALPDETASVKLHGSLRESSTRADNVTDKISSQEVDIKVERCKIVSQSMEIKDLYPKDEENVSKSIQSSPFIPVQADGTREVQEELKETLHEEQICENVIEENNITFDVTEEELKTNKLERYSSVQEEQSSKEITGTEDTKMDITEDTLSVSQDSVADRTLETTSSMEDDKHNHDEREVNKSIGETVLEEPKKGLDSNSDKPQVEKGHKINILDGFDLREKLASFQPQKNQEDMPVNEELLNSHGIPSNIDYEESAEVVGVTSPGSIDEEVKCRNLCSQENFEKNYDMEAPKVDDERKYNPTSEILNAKEASIEKNVETDTYGVAFEVLLSELEEQDIAKLNKISELVTEGKLESSSPQNDQNKMQRDSLNTVYNLPVSSVYKESALTGGVEFTLEQIVDEDETFRMTDKEVKNSNLVFQKDFQTYTQKRTNEVSHEWVCNPTNHALFAKEASTYEDTEEYTSVMVSDKYFHAAMEDKTISEKDIPGKDERFQDADINSETVEEGKKQDERSEIQPQHIASETISVDWSDKEEMAEAKNILKGVPENNKLDNMEPEYTLFVVSEEIQTIAATIDNKSLEIDYLKSELEKNIHRDAEKMLEKEMAELNTVNNSDEAHFPSEEGPEKQKESFTMALDYIETGPSIDDEDTKKNHDATVMAKPEEEITEVGQKLDELSERETKHEEIQKDEAEIEKEKEPDTNYDPGAYHATNASSTNENSMMALDNIQSGSSIADKDTKITSFFSDWNSAMTRDNIQSGPSIDDQDTNMNLDVLVIATSEKEITELDQKLEELSEKEMEHKEFQEVEVKTDRGKEQEANCELSTSHVANASLNNEVNDVKCFPSGQSFMMALDNIETGILIDVEDTEKNSDAIVMAITEKEITEAGQKFDEVPEKDIEHEELQRNEAETEKKKETQLYPGTNHAANESSNNEDSIMALDNIESRPSIDDEDVKKNSDAIVMATSEKQITEVGQKLDEVPEKEMKYGNFHTDEVETEKEKKPETYCEPYTSHAANASKNNEVNDVKYSPSEQSSMMALDNIETGQSIDGEDTKKNPDTIVIATSGNEITEVDQKLDEVSKKEMELEELLKVEDETKREEEQDIKCDPGTNHATKASPNNENSIVALDNIETAPLKYDEDTKKNLDAIVKAASGKEITELGQQLDEVSENKMEHGKFQADEAEAEKEKKPEMNYESGTTYAENASPNNETSTLGLDRINTGPLIDDEDKKTNIDAIVMATSDDEIMEVGQVLDEVSQKEKEHEELQKAEPETEKEKEPDTKCDPGTNHAVNASPNNENSMMTSDKKETGPSRDSEDTKNFDVIFLATSEKEITEVGQKLDEVPEKELEHEELQKDEVETQKERKLEMYCEPGTCLAANAFASDKVNDVKCFPSDQCSMIALDNIKTGPSVDDEDTKKNHDAIVMETSENKITELGWKLDDISEKEIEHEELGKDEAKTEKGKEPYTKCDPGTNDVANASLNNEVNDAKCLLSNQNSMMDLDNIESGSSIYDEDTKFKCLFSNQNSKMDLDNIESGASIDDKDTKKNLDVIVMATPEKEITELSQKLDELSEKEMVHEEFQEHEVKNEKEKEQKMSCEPGTSHVVNESLDNEVNDVKSFHSEQNSMMALDNIETGPLVDVKDTEKNSHAIVKAVTEKEITEVGQRFDEVSEKDIEHEELQKDEAETEKEKEQDTQCYPGINHAENASSNNKVNYVKCFASEKDFMVALDNTETGPSIDDGDMKKNFDTIVITTSGKQIAEVGQKLNELAKQELEHEEFQKDEIETEKAKKQETYCEPDTNHAANALKDNESSMMSLDNLETGQSTDDEDTKKILDAMTILDAIVMETLEKKIIEVDQKLDEVSEKKMEPEELQKAEAEIEKENKPETVGEAGANHAVNASPNNEVNDVKCLPSEKGLNNIEPGPSMNVDITNKNLDAIFMATSEREIVEVGQKLDEVTDIVPRDSSEEANTNNEIDSEYQKEEKSDPEGQAHANNSEYNCTGSASAREKSIVCPVTVEINVKDKDVPEGTLDVSTNQNLGISTICQEGRENTGEPSIIVSEDEVEEENISSIEALEDSEKLNKLSSLQELEVKLPTEERETCDAKPIGEKPENHGEHLNDATIPKQRVLFLSTDPVESMPEAQREHGKIEIHSHDVEEDIEDEAPEDYVTPHSNLSYPSSSTAVNGYVRDENIPKQEVVPTSSQAEQVNEINYVESNAESLDTSNLVKEQKDPDGDQTMEKTVVEGDERPFSNHGDTYPIATDVKNGASGLLCQVSTDVFINDTKSMISREQSGPHKKEEIQQSRDLQSEQDEKIHAADKNIESRSINFDVSYVSRAQQVTSLKEGSKAGNTVLQDHENIDKATSMEKTPLISESVRNTKSFLQSDETTEIPEYNQNEKALEVSNTKARLDIMSEAEKSSEENHDGNSKNHVENMDINYVEESKTGQVDEHSPQDKEKELNLADTLLKDEKTEEGKEEKEEKDGSPEEKHVIEIINTQQEEDTNDEEKEEKEEGDEKKVEDNNAAVMEKGKDDESKSAHKKSHNILSGVGSKVKHSLSKVKKAIIGKSSHSKTASRKQ